MGAAAVFAAAFDASGLGVLARRGAARSPDLAAGLGAVARLAADGR